MKKLTFFSILLCGILAFQIKGREQQFHNSLDAKILVAFRNIQKIILQDKKLLYCLYCEKLYTEDNFKTHILSKVFFPSSMLDPYQHAPFVYYQNLHPYKVTTFVQGKSAFCPIPICTLRSSNNPIINLNHIIKVHTDLKQVNKHFIEDLDSTCWCGSNHKQ